MPRKIPQIGRLTSGVIHPQPPPPPSLYTTGAVVLNGASDFLSLNALNSTDTGQILFSLWMYSTQLQQTTIWWGNFGASQFVGIGTAPNNYGDIFLGSSLGGAQQISGTTTTKPVQQGLWQNFIGRLETNFGAGFKIKELYCDDLPVTFSGGVNQGAAFIAAFNGQPFALANDDHGDYFVGYMADFWFATNQTMDLSVTANRRKFISDTGKPVDLGADGSTPTGIAPTIFLRIPSGGTASGFASDLSGNGNDFTITGTLTLAPTSPSD